MSNITLYYAKGTCSFAHHAIINHLNIQDIKLVAVDLRSHTTQSGEDFYKINPKGNVPTLVINDDFKLVEGLAVAQYLSDNYNGQHLSGQDDAKYKIQNFLSFLNSEIHKSGGIFFNSKINDDFVENVAIPNFKNKLTYLESQLKEGEFLVDDQLSLADFTLFALIRMFKAFLKEKLESQGIKFEDYQNLNSHYQKLSELPSIQQTLKREGLSA